jgi:hypothetical protein
MEKRRWMAPLLGLVFIVLVIVGFAVGGEPPDLDEGAAEAAEFYLDNEDEVVIGSLIQGLAAVVFVFFGGVLRSRLREVEDPRGTLSAIVFGGTIIFATGLAIDATINIAAADAVDDVDPVTIHTLASLWQNDWIPFAVGMLTFMIGTGLSIIRFGILPRWLGWIAILLAIIAATPIAGVGFIGTGVFIIVISVILARRERHGPGPAATTPAAPPPAL